MQVEERITILMRYADPGKGIQGLPVVRAFEWVKSSTARRRCPGRFEHPDPRRSMSPLFVIPVGSLRPPNHGLRPTAAAVDDDKQRKNINTDTASRDFIIPLHRYGGKKGRLERSKNRNRRMKNRVTAIESRDKP